MDLDEDPRPIPAVNFQLEPPSMEPESNLHESQGSIKELSMIAEDDEPAERSRVSLPAPPVIKPATSPAPLPLPAVDDAEDEFHEPAEEPPQSEPMQTDDEPEDAPVAPADHFEEPPLGDTTSASANTSTLR